MVEKDGLAPVIPLFGGRSVDRSPNAESPVVEPLELSPTDEADDEPTWRTEWDDDPEVGSGPIDAQVGAEDRDAERDLAAQSLLKKLRTRSLSVREARAAVALRDLDSETVDAVIREFIGHGYLDDAALAEQLVHSGLDRKGQGRQAIAQTLAKRGIPRDVADAALDELPDDDAERALEFARTKARSMVSLDRDTALRRLVGQLSRRGYNGSVAMTAATKALDENGGRSTVRFR